MRACLLLVLAASISLLGACQPEPYQFDRPAFTVVDERLSHPADVVRFKGHYIAAEIFNNRLAIFSDLKLSDLRYFDPKQIGKSFRAPHFLAVTPRDTLLISNGWGKSIVEVADLDGSGWREFEGVDRKFHGPHGICVDNDGWIYVGDSLNSRLVRFRDMTGKGWQVFADLDKRVGYIRQLVCRDSVVWASNSYENRAGLNAGHGGNILKIDDFDTGRAEVVFAFEKSNLTGVMPVDESHLLLGLWSVRRQLVLHHIGLNKSRLFDRIDIGTPYGIYKDRANNQILVAHIGETKDARRMLNPGGIAVYRR